MVSVLNEGMSNQKDSHALSPVSLIGGAFGLELTVIHSTQNVLQKAKFVGCSNKRTYK